MLQQQIKTMQIQINMIRAQLNAHSSRGASPSTMADLYGILGNINHLTEEDIRDVKFDVDYSDFENE